MSIQGTINQGLSLAALLATQSPEYKARAEKRSKLKNLEAQEKAVEKQTMAIGQNEDLGPEDAITFHGSKMADIYEERFNVDPTAENLEKLRGFVDEREHGVERYHEEQLAAHQAENDLLVDYQAPDQALAKEQAVRRESRKRRNFKDYMMNEPISLGGSAFATFKDVSPDIQKQILSSYSRGEKTKMMNERDKLNG